MKISVALCTYNGEKFLKEQLESILNQSQQIQELIICDDKSNDSTSEILKQYQSLYPNQMFLYFNNSSLGTIKNFEKAISLTTGDLIFLSDQDDIWNINKVNKMVNFFKENKACKLLFSNGSLINENGVPLGSSLWDKWNFDSQKRELWKNNRFAFKDLVINNNKITGATICFHKDLKDQCLPINVPYGYWHDAWLGLHAAGVDGLFFVESCVIKYRIHDEQQVGISSNINKDIILRANKKFISKGKFYKHIGKLFPEKNDLIPNFKEHTSVTGIINAIKRKIVNKKN